MQAILTCVWRGRCTDSLLVSPYLVFSRMAAIFSGVIHSEPSEERARFVIIIIIVGGSSRSNNRSITTNNLKSILISRSGSRIRCRRSIRGGGGGRHSSRLAGARILRRDDGQRGVTNRSSTEHLDGALTREREQLEIDRRKHRKIARLLGKVDDGLGVNQAQRLSHVDVESGNASSERRARLSRTSSSTSRTVHSATFGLLSRVKRRLNQCRRVEHKQCCVPCSRRRRRAPLLRRRLWHGHVGSALFLPRVAPLRPMSFRCKVSSSSLIETDKTEEINRKKFDVRFVLRFNFFFFFVLSSTASGS
jgi:hypothetical protein